VNRDGTEAVLAEFRSWLSQTLTASLTGPDEPAAEPVDLASLAGQFVALRHEVNLQTKATRQQQEQNAETLRQLSAALEMARAASTRSPSSEEEQLRPILKTLVDVADALRLARREFQRSQQAILDSLAQLEVRPEPVAPSPPPAPLPSGSLWTRIFAGSNAPVPVVPSLPLPQPNPAAEATQRVRKGLEGLITGYGMSLQRLDRSLQQLGLERLECVGQPFDPERMEVVEVVSETSRPAGEVIEEIRPGYLWRGRVFRYAQVSVARPAR
jgi:hypothetical protein